MPPKKKAFAADFESIHAPFAGQCRSRTLTKNGWEEIDGCQLRRSNLERGRPTPPHAEARRFCAARTTPLPFCAGRLHEHAASARDSPRSAAARGPRSDSSPGAWHRRSRIHLDASSCCRTQIWRSQDYVDTGVGILRPKSNVPDVHVVLGSSAGGRRSPSAQPIPASCGYSGEVEACETTNKTHARVEASS